MKEHPDINDTLRTEGEAAARARHDSAPRYQRNGTGGTADLGSAPEEQPKDASPPRQVGDQGSLRRVLYRQ
jgi:hypothetical protein